MAQKNGRVPKKAFTPREERIWNDNFTTGFKG